MIGHDLIAALLADRASAVHAFGWLMIGLGVVAFCWAAFDDMRGQTSTAQFATGRFIPVLESEEPRRFRRYINLTIFAGVISVAAGAYLLVFM